MRTLDQLSKDPEAFSQLGQASHLEGKSHHFYLSILQNIKVKEKKMHLIPSNPQTSTRTF